MEIEIKKFQKIFKELIEGKSLRKLEAEYGINRENILKKIRDIFPEDSEELKKLEMILEYNKTHNPIKRVSSIEMKEIAESLFSKEINITEAAQDLDMDILTFKERLVEYVINSNDAKLKKRYIRYENERKPDYSHINFNALLIEMLRTNLSQSEIAEEYGILPRRIGREIEKLKDDEKYSDLYVLCKEHAKRKMHREEFSSFEKDVINRLLDKYDDQEIIIKNAKTKDEIQYERALKVVQIAENTPGTPEEKAKKAGVSVSTLRRMKKTIEKHNQLDEK